MTIPKPTDRLAQIETRLARMESRLVQMMIALNLDPEKRYGPPPPVRTRKPFNAR